MLLILSRNNDVAAHGFAERFAEQDIRVMTCEEIAQNGISWQLDDMNEAMPTSTPDALVHMHNLKTEDIHGVITRFAMVSEVDLPHIVEQDRAYVASEMHAFLLAFLDALPCPLLNRPSLGCLYGPALRASQWNQLARDLAIPVLRDFRQDALAALPRDAFTEVTIVGEQILGTTDKRLLHWSKALAECAGTAYLGLHYMLQDGDYYFVGADPYPRLESEVIQDALSQYFSNDTLAGGAAW